MFVVIVNVEIDVVCGDDIDEVGIEIFEECVVVFGMVDGFEDLESFCEMMKSSVSGVLCDSGLCCMSGFYLGLVEVGLEVGFEDVEGSGYGGCSYVFNIVELS